MLTSKKPYAILQECKTENIGNFELSCLRRLRRVFIIHNSYSSGGVMEGQSMGIAGNGAASRIGKKLHPLHNLPIAGLGLFL